MTIPQTYIYSPYFSLVITEQQDPSHTVLFPIKKIASQFGVLDQFGVLNYSTWTWSSVCQQDVPRHPTRSANTEHYDDVIMGAMASQITSHAILYSTVYSDADQRKHQSSASLAFVRGIHRGPVNSPHKWPVTRKMSPFDDVIMVTDSWTWCFKVFPNLRKIVFFWTT